MVASISPLNFGSTDGAEGLQVLQQTNPRILIAVGEANDTPLKAAAIFNTTFKFVGASLLDDAGSTSATTPEVIGVAGIYLSEHIQFVLDINASNTVAAEDGATDSLVGNVFK